MALSRLFGAKIQPGIIKPMPFCTSRRGETDGGNENHFLIAIRAILNKFRTSKLKNKRKSDLLSQVVPFNFPYSKQMRNPHIYIYIEREIDIKEGFD